MENSESSLIQQQPEATKKSIIPFIDLAAGIFQIILLILWYFTVYKELLTVYDSLEVNIPITVYLVPTIAILISVFITISSIYLIAIQTKRPLSKNEIKFGTIILGLFGLQFILGTPFLIYSTIAPVYGLVSQF